MAFDPLPPDFELFKLATFFLEKKIEKKILEKKISPAGAGTSFWPKRPKSAIFFFVNPPPAPPWNYFLWPPPSKKFYDPLAPKSLLTYAETHDDFSHNELKNGLKLSQRNPKNRLCILAWDYEMSSLLIMQSSRRQTLFLWIYDQQFCVSFFSVTLLFYEGCSNPFSSSNSSLQQRVLCLHCTIAYCGNSQPNSSKQLW